jgi:hypothetical protein
MDCIYFVNNECIAQRLGSKYKPTNEEKTKFCQIEDITKLSENAFLKCPRLNAYHANLRATKG